MVRLPSQHKHTEGAPASFADIMALAGGTYTDVESWAFIGIDPGASGAMAVIMPYHEIFAGKSVTRQQIMTIKMPEEHGEILEWILRYSSGNGFRSIAVIEEVSGWMGGNALPTADGGVRAHGGQPGSAMFKFGMSYGALLMALTAAGFVEGQSFHKVRPKAWQRAVGAPSTDRKQKGAKEQHKRDLKAYAQSLFPSEQVTLWKADALLLAEYARRNYGG